MKKKFVFDEKYVFYGFMFELCDDYLKHQGEVSGKKITQIGRSKFIHKSVRQKKNFKLNSKIDQEPVNLLRMGYVAN